MTERTDTPTEIERPDATTPAYALRELADWIEHRANQSRPTHLNGIPQTDLTRIQLGREMADSLDSMFEVHSNTVAALHARIVELEGMKDLRTVRAKLDEILDYLGGPSVVAPDNGDELIGADMANSPDRTEVTRYRVPVANTPSEPVEAHECSTLEFDRETLTGILKVRCDLGRCTDIDLRALEQMVGRPQDGIMDMARRIASEHGLDVRELFEKMRGHSPGDLKTITVGTPSLPTR